MKPFIGRQANRTVARVVAASVLTIASVHLVQAQQPAATSSNGTTTHAAKEAELKKLEKNGYQPTATDSHYPQDIQNAEKKAGTGGAANQPAAGGQATQ